MVKDNRGEAKGDEPGFSSHRYIKIVGEVNLIITFICIKHSLPRRRDRCKKEGSRRQPPEEKDKQQ